MSDDDWFAQRREREEREAEERRRESEVDEEWRDYQRELARQKSQLKPPNTYGSREPSVFWGCLTAVIVCICIVVKAYVPGLGRQKNDQAAKLYQLRVSAQEQWVDTGVIIRKGQTVEISGIGLVKTIATSKDSFTPLGGLDQQCTQACTYPQGRFGQLVGRIGYQGVVFPIGNLRGNIQGSGPLYLAVNDCCDWTDNSGYFTVFIVVQ